MQGVGVEICSNSTNGALFIGESLSPCPAVSLAKTRTQLQGEMVGRLVSARLLACVSVTARRCQCPWGEQPADARSQAGTVLITPATVASSLAETSGPRLQTTSWE